MLLLTLICHFSSYLHRFLRFSHHLALVPWHIIATEFFSVIYPYDNFEFFTFCSWNPEVPSLSYFFPSLCSSFPTPFRGYLLSQAVLRITLGLAASNHSWFMWCRGSNPWVHACWASTLTSSHSSSSLTPLSPFVFCVVRGCSGTCFLDQVNLNSRDPLAPALMLDSEVWPSYLPLFLRSSLCLNCRGQGQHLGFGNHCVSCLMILGVSMFQYHSTIWSFAVTRFICRELCDKDKLRLPNLK